MAQIDIIINQEVLDYYRLPWRMEYWETYGKTVLVNADGKLVLNPMPSQDRDIEFLLMCSRLFSPDPAQ